ncbi:MAG: murein biosynthesis integral membrane protein MurJ [Aeromicrobium sp.]
MSENQNIVAASAWMALGTIFSRLTGFLRLLLLFFVIGKSLNADIFNNANTVPNALYILVAGGIFNVVLVPQLVRAMKYDPDGGDSYANRVITLGLLVLAAATVILIAAVPLLLHVFFSGKLFDPGNEQQLQSAQLLMWLCMPQVVFYGAFVLVGQILNARGRFGPMMWAPIANNIAACAVLVVYAVVFGYSDATDGFTTSQSLLLGLGSTAAIALQLGVLVPYLRKAGFRYKARFDFRGVGLSHTLRLGVWTLLFILANQVAFIVVNRLGTRATLEGRQNGTEAAGSAVYELGFLVSQVPHGVITVSLATAIIPTLSALAADGRYERFRLELGRTVRIVLIIVVPLAVTVACLGQQAGTVAGLFGALKGNTEVIGYTIQAFSLAMIAFAVHYLMLRGFYANENTRTPFFIQVVIASVLILASVVLTSMVSPARVAMMLALSYGIAYVVGSILSVTLLSRSVGRVIDRQMVVFSAKLSVAAAAAAVVMLGAAFGLERAGLDPTQPAGGLSTLFVAGAAGAIVYLLSAKLLRLEEVAYIASTLLRRRAVPN